jgi:hypothetical protein
MVYQQAKRMMTSFLIHNLITSYPHGTIFLPQLPQTPREVEQAMIPPPICTALLFLPFPTSIHFFLSLVTTSYILR